MDQGSDVKWSRSILCWQNCDNSNEIMTKLSF